MRASISSSASMSRRASLRSGSAICRATLGLGQHWDWGNTGIGATPDSGAELGRERGGHGRGQWTARWTASGWGSHLRRHVERGLLFGEVSRHHESGGDRWVEMSSTDCSGRIDRQGHTQSPRRREAKGCRPRVCILEGTDSSAASLRTHRSQ